MDEFTFEELFFDGIPDAQYGEFANLCQDTGNHPNITTDNSAWANTDEVIQSRTQDMSLLSEDEKRTLQSIPSLCQKVEDLCTDNKDSIAEMNTMRRFLERLESWVREIHDLLQNIDDRLAQGAGKKSLDSKDDGCTNGRSTDEA
ncbi:hypothetical protein DBV05_g12043 [Lasiodiplodia theobromae]|uniref:Uncharacterized protein n=1 Tax=Lasiodiplodia theobromae TaxID=45133 RepID=A0A5N5CVF0_9PEZI|nr:hypothetical protein DBV05_g12043 [Lasiodiplodia theobromae]